MLDTLTKRRIDTARDILVGKLPDPKSQVEQITIALIYKFMDDMDKQSEELGGKTKFFTGEYEKYSWSKIFDPRVSGYELVGLYGEAIQKMNHNPNIPLLFRNIFKNAYLPYRDPETLKMFLKVIGEFEYDYSEKLGDAFEYLLSIMGSQGDAGQFRTPRHIIDFMVKVVDPSKNETILDPACGTAGFLISSFNHIQNKNKKDGRINLTPDERARLIENLSGYDISPDMVRLSLVNMYLHGFQSPKIYEYDTLASEEKWNEFYDIILANPPFMSPMGGIRPHKRFSIQANRSEVLFVDYIAEHLNPNGRGGVIVPEGIIFQSGNAYKKLRKMLIETSLYAVVSLPAGVFNPYSGVKTSILFLNKNLAKKTNKILFIKVNNDGFGLGAQRRKIQENDLPDAYRAIMEYKQTLISGDKFNEDTWQKIKVIEKCKIAKGGDYNLSTDRYGVAKIHANIKWPMVEIGKVVDIESGSRQKGGAISSGIPSIGGEQINKHGDIRFEKMKYITNEHFQSMKKGILKQGDVLIVKDGATTGKTSYFDSNEKAAVNEHVFILRARQNILSKYLYSIIRSEDFQQKLKPYIKGIIGGISLEVKGIKIPLPSLPVQEEIVAELGSYQKIINGVRQIVENYKPTFKIDPEWETVKLGDVCKFVRGPFGGSLKKEIFVEKGYKVYEQKHAIQNNFMIGEYYITSDKFQEMKRFEVKSGDLIISCSGTMGKIAIVPQNIERGIINQALLKLTPDYNKINSMYIKLVLETSNIQIKYFQNTSGAAIKNVSSVKYLQTIKIPLPSIEIQQKIIAQIEKEQKTINANKELITIFENKIKDKIADVWGE